MLTRFTLPKEVRARRNKIEARSELLHAVYTELDCCLIVHILLRVILRRVISAIARWSMFAPRLLI
jgi:hypothetical protein